MNADGRRLERRSYIRSIRYEDTESWRRRRGRRLAPLGETLFRSPYILRQLGFNALQIQQGFYRTPAGQLPFTVEAIP